jgi:hypothetical protein
MNWERLILAIFLLSIVILSISYVSAEDITDNTQIQENEDITIIGQANDSKLSSEQTIAAGSNSSAIQEKNR